MRVDAALAEELSREGVEYLFGLMGEDTAKLIIECERVGIRFIGARHENQAVGMADGYARASGKLAVAAITSGPGFTNALTLITTASRARSPVLVIVGAKYMDDRLAEAESKQVGKYFPCLATCEVAGIEAMKPTDPDHALSEIRSAIQVAKAGRTIVANLAVDLLDLDVSMSPAEPQAPSPDAGSQPALPGGEQMSTVADLLQEDWAVQRPVLIAGRGAVQAGAGPILRRLAELTGALLAVTLPATALFDDDPWNLGVCGTFSNSLASRLITEADCILAFGASLNFLTTFGGSLFTDATVIHVDHDAASIGQFVEVEPELAVNADARVAAERLVAVLEERGHQSTGYRTSEVGELLAAFDPASDFSEQSGPEHIDPRTLMIALDRILPRDRTVVIDGGHQMSFSTRYLSVQRPEDLLLPFETGSIGVGVGEAIGAALAAPDRLCVLGTGDASMLMALGDLETAVRYGVPLVIVVSNDLALGAEVHYLDAIGAPAELAMHTTPSFSTVAHALGAEGFTIKTKADIDLVEERLGSPVDGPIVLDCYVNPRVRAEWVELIYLRESPADSSPTAAGTS